MGGRCFVLLGKSREFSVLRILVFMVCLIFRRGRVGDEGV